MHRYACVAGTLVLAMTTSVAAAAETFVEQFQGVYGTSNHDRALFVLETADGGFLVSGERTGVSTLVVKTDAAGEPQWQKELTSPSGVLTAAAVVHGPGGGFVVGGYISPTTRPGGGYWDAIMIGLDADGNEQWRTVFGGDGSEFIYNMKLADDGTVIATGMTQSSDIPGNAAGERHVYVARVSATGTVLDQRAYQVGASAYEEGFDIVQADAGGFMIIGGAEYPKNMFLLRLEEDLDSVWSNTYDAVDYQTVVNNGTGGFLVAGAIGNPSYANAILAQFDADPLDPDGPLVMRAGWPKTYMGPDFDIYSIFYRADITADGGIIAAGFHYVVAPDPPNPPSEQPRVWVVKLDADGVIEREGIYARGGARGGVWPTSDGGYAVVGAAFNFPGGSGGNDMYVLKLIDVLEPGTVEGTFWFDSDATCSVTAGDVGAASRLIRFTDQETDAAFVAMSRSDGTYSAVLPPGDYEAVPVPSSIAEEPETCGPSGQSFAVSVTAGGTTPGSPLFGGCDCGVSQTLTGQAIPPLFNCPSGSPTTPCFGHPWQLCYGVTNLCNPLLQNPGGGGNFVKACVNLPPNLTYAGPPSFAASGCGGGGGNWTLVSTSATGQVCFQLANNTNMPTGCHSDLCFPISVGASYTGGTITAQFSTNQCPFVPAAPPLTYGSMCSCDPNAMHVQPQGCGAEGSITAQELTYRIDFQNLGAGAAHDVVITDALDSDLDPSTIRLLDSSHSITGFQVDAAGELEVRFDGIELPPEVLDAAGSQGHVTFAISPIEPFADGTVVENGASIVFDANDPVLTNIVTNTLYAGDPVPVVDFSAVATGETVDFSYTGGTTGASLEWDFGPDASPRTSTDASPAGIAFAGPGAKPVLLRATKAGCTAEAAGSVDVSCDGFWDSGAFESPMGGRARRVGSRITLKMRLSYRGEPVLSQAQLEQILDDDFDRVPEGDCWPRVRIFDDQDQEVELDESSFMSAQPNPNGCFRIRKSGLMTLKLKLQRGRFEPGRTYRAEVQNYTCTLHPENEEFTMKP